MGGAIFLPFFILIRMYSAKQVMLFSLKSFSMFNLSFCSRIYSTLASLSFSYTELNLQASNWQMLSRKFSLRCCCDLVLGPIFFQCVSRRQLLMVLEMIHMRVQSIHRWCRTIWIVGLDNILLSPNTKLHVQECTTDRACSTSVCRRVGAEALICA